MWYVVQTQTGEEQNLKEILMKLVPEGLISECIIPLYEDVWRKGGTGHISIKRLFPGYLLVRTDAPDAVFTTLKRIPRFTRLLGMDEKDGSKVFLPVSDEEMNFLDSIIEDGIMHVSYIRLGKNGRIEKIRGPLSNHATRITRLDVPHRRAIVDTELFGRSRKIKFGLWTDSDPALPWLEGQKDSDVSDIDRRIMDIGIHEGDAVMDDTGIYGDLTMKVIKVDPARRMILTTAEMFGTTVRIELSADGVRKVKLN